MLGPFEGHSGFTQLLLEARARRAAARTNARSASDDLVPVMVAPAVAGELPIPDLAISDVAIDPPTEDASAPDLTIF